MNKQYFINMNNICIRKYISLVIILNKKSLFKLIKESFVDKKIKNSLFLIKIKFKEV